MQEEAIVVHLAQTNMRRGPIMVIPLKSEFVYNKINLHIIIPCLFIVIIHMHAGCTHVCMI